MSTIEHANVGNIIPPEASATELAPVVAAAQTTWEAVERVGQSEDLFPGYHVAMENGVATLTESSRRPGSYRATTIEYDNSADAWVVGLRERRTLRQESADRDRVIYEAHSRYPLRPGAEPTVTQVAGDIVNGNVVPVNDTSYRHDTLPPLNTVGADELLERLNAIQTPRRSKAASMIAALLRR
jgi:hypothetical protein